MNLINVNQTEIAVFEYSHKGEPVVLLHPGGIFASFVWKDTAELLKENYHVIAMDLRGHGASGKPETGYELENLAKDIVEAIKAMGIEKAHFIGNSLGAETALVLAAKFPAYVRSLTLVDGGMLNLIGPNGEREGTKEELVKERLERPYPEFISKEDFVYFAKEHWQEFAKIAHQIPLYNLPNGTVTFQQNNEIAAQLLAAGCDIDIPSQYEGLTCPVLFMPAEKEERLEWKLKLIEAKSASLPYSKTVILPESTHLMMMNQGREIAEAAQAFYQELQEKCPQ
ncbi:alpha/beta fold hydrolase [Falsibacillus pallidus]|uniref:2-succinyl-6-hydroxy-2, 4-cyclohexadiene-1-carboxylate synthase n=1 Tax=Falsibacillus pallidus TaxID=493781 RepID=A0A370GBD5_9BACI|nr:alpha/beta hydrolase [Falsibacillus pallidus]RDI41017.1 2-succinyl-6-hydroxy-2,4-cyclohexadiene-1-carboxylate synthase [Falsibacillus pallidus]